MARAYRSIRRAGMAAALAIAWAAGAAAEGGAPAGFSPVKILDDLAFPSAVAFLPDGRILYNERLAGRVRLVEAGAVREAPVLAIADLSTRSEQGLLGLVLHPGFAENGYLYVYYTQAEPLRNRVVRYAFDAGTGTAAEDIVILDDIPANFNHNAGVLEFAPDGTLLIQVGDAQVASRARSLGHLSGKILRLRDDGAIPSDNPFVDVLVARKEIFATGHRNGFGLAPDRIAPEPLRVYVSENGPGSYDEVNLAGAATDLGWPDHVRPDLPPPGTTPPIWEWPDTVAPTGIARYDGGVYPASYLGDLYVGHYNDTLVAPEPLDTDTIQRLRLDETGTAVVESRTFVERDNAGIGRVIDVLQGPDALLYFATRTALWRIEFDVAAYLAGTLDGTADPGEDVGDAVATLRRAADLAG